MMNLFIRKKLYITVFVFCVCISWFNILKAQDYEPIRIEFPAQIDAKNYHFENLGSEGILLFYESNEINKEDKKRKWYFSLLDSTLAAQRISFLSLTDGLAFQKSSISDNIQALFFMSQNEKNEKNYEIVWRDNNTQQFNILGGKLAAKSKIVSFELLNSNLVIGINLPDGKADILVYNLSDGSMKVPHLNFSNPIIIKSIQSIKKNRKFVASLREYKSKKYFENTFLIFSETGELIKKYNINGLENVSLGESNFCFDEDENLISIGTYERETDIKINEESEEYMRESIGIYFMKFNDMAIEKEKYFAFKNMPNIYSALSPESLMKVRELQSKKKNKLQAVTFMFNQTQLTELDTIIFFSAEALQPRYRYETRVSYDFYGRPITYTYTIFDGYDFFTSLLISFDKEGNLIWNNHFPIGNILSYELDNHTSTYYLEDEIIVSMVKDGQIISQSFDYFNGDKIGEMGKLNIAMTYANDKLKEENFSFVQHWYSNYFLISGVQKINNNRLRNDSQRIVFFLQKVAFE